MCRPRSVLGSASTSVCSALLGNMLPTLTALHVKTGISPQNLRKTILNSTWQRKQILTWMQHRFQVLVCSHGKSAEETSFQTSSSNSFQMAHTFITKYGWLTSLQSVLLRVRSVHDLFCPRFCVWGNRGHCCSKGYPLLSPPPHHSLLKEWRSHTKTGLHL